MKNKSIILGALFVLLGVSTANAQINFGEKALGAVQKGVAGFTFSDADAASLSKAAVDKMDAEHVITGAKDPYTLRLNKLFGKHKTTEGVALNYKVYKLNEVNAFATADGSVRVYSGLMDIMDDNELLAVIGHEIGHVVNTDSRDAIKAAYKKEAALGLIASQSDKVAAITDSQLAKVGSQMIDSKHSRKQESEADEFSYNFMKNNGYNVNAVSSAFGILAKMSEGAESSFLEKMMSSHPDPKERAENAKLRAEKDGLYKPYVKQKPVVAKKAPVKKKK
ncbi:peptidase [Flavobacterium sp. SOK18b]|uniref:M48 family metalloprotease n=1 Tax=unclassified Flavobacterium TaxID=196869 RepID=UPI0015FE7499|nr:MULTISPECIES: M48 family metalloprotease [unclassified Flavobacterium]MBB1193315.1 peptidase [Flavobacterium sp. SOK18b]QZK89729.1 M48 family metalloprotease [Flavobacterium sp. CHNK8]